VGNESLLKQDGVSAYQIGIGIGIAIGDRHLFIVALAPPHRRCRI
jgi:hypothetical protein